MQGQIEYQNTQKTHKAGILKFYKIFKFFQIVQCSVQSGLTWVEPRVTSCEASLRKVRFNEPLK